MTDPAQDAIRSVRNLCAEESYVEAERILRDALSFEPGNNDLQLELAEVLAKMGNEQEAERVLRGILKVAPRNERAVSVLGHLLDSALRTEEAAELYRNFIAIEPDSHCVVDDLCRLLYSEGQTRAALALARDHAEAYPDEYHAYDALRFVLNQIEDDNEFAADEGASKAKLMQLTAENLLEQHSLAVRMVHIARAKGLDTEIVNDSEEELARVRAELAHLRRKTTMYSTRLNPDLEKQIQEILSGKKCQSR